MERCNAAGPAQKGAPRSYSFVIAIKAENYLGPVLIAPRFFLLLKRLLKVPVLRVSGAAGDTPPSLLPVIAVLLLLLRLFEKDGLADGEKSA